jgi:hypothetical protein
VQGDADRTVSPDWVTLPAEKMVFFKGVITDDVTDVFAHFGKAFWQRNVTE